MALIRADHLPEQARKLTTPPPSAPPRQADLGRAVSASYCAVFHHVLTAAANDVVGLTKQQTIRYALVYRSVDHRTLRDLCTEASEQMPKTKIRRYVPGSAFDANIQTFSSAVVERMERRHAADYDPTIRIKTPDVSSAIQLAETAMRRFDTTDAVMRQAFISLLLSPAR